MTVYHQTPVTREESELKRVPANLETAAFSCLVNATWEDIDLVALLNTALTTAVKDIIDVTKSVYLHGVLEILNGDGLAHTVKWADAGTPDNDDTVKEFATLLAIGSEHTPCDIVCSHTDGFAKFEADVVAQATFVYHLTSFEYIQDAVE